MASDHDGDHHRTPPHSIPLQDLSRGPDAEQDQGRNRSYSRGRAPPHRRSILRGRDVAGGGLGLGHGYERVAEGSPNPVHQTHSPPRRPTLVVPSNSSSPYRGYDEGDPSPLEDRGGFQEALGFAGLSFQEAQPPRPLAEPRMLAGSGHQTQEHRDPGWDSEESQVYNVTHDSESDRTPLTDPNHLQPISGAQMSRPGDRPQDRSSFQGVRFSTSASSGARLGDDLPSAEAGLRRASALTDEDPSHRRQRSLSPSTASPLVRAGSMMRKMSQRVVNLSNEPDMIEQSMRRKPSQARLQEPPIFPAMTEYAHDEPNTRPMPVEKLSFVKPGSQSTQTRHPYHPENPLKGKALGIFPADSPIRTKLCDLLVHPSTEPTILVLIVIQTVLLAIESAPSVVNNPRPTAWPSKTTPWIDYALLILFIIYTLEIAARIIVSGFIVNPQEYSSHDRQKGLITTFLEASQALFSLQRQTSKRSKPNPFEAPQPSILRSFTGMQAQADHPGHSRQQQRIRLARRAFLRHSFNRLDFVAVSSFWISFILAIMGHEHDKHIYVFRMLSCLRILRLLGLTSGTSVILRSLKKAAPMLVNVAFLIGFFWLLFAIIGVQSFKASLRRTCVWIDPSNASNNFTNAAQFCGGQLNNVTGKAEAWYNADGITLSGESHKGYLCPRNSRCVQGSNPYGGTVSFDNLLQSLQLIFVIMSSNTFTDLMYDTTESDYLISAIFFAAGIVILSLWLMNLLVAVITSSFQVIREESKTSAFTTEEDDNPIPEDHGTPKVRAGSLKRAYDNTSWVWTLIIVYGLLVQCLRSATMSASREHLVNTSETAVTLLLLVEILFRFASDWRHFHEAKRNWVDLGLAIITTVIQIPPIHNSGQPYAWLSLFQILRVYRVVLAVSVTRELIMVVLGNVSGILNLILFVVLITFLTAIFAVQLFRGQIPQVDSSQTPIRITFFNIYNSFLGMYQVLSSENWTQIMYNVTTYNAQFGTAWIGAAFFVLWFILANFVVLNMFIAVIQENFDVTEDEKRLEQVKAFLQQRELGSSYQGNLSLTTIFQMGRRKRQKDPMDYGPATMEMLLKDAVVRDFLDDQAEPLSARTTTGPNNSSIDAGLAKLSMFGSLREKLSKYYHGRETNPFYSGLKFSRRQQELDPRAMAQEVLSATEQRKRAQREYLVKHPKYNVSLYIFKPSSPIRRFCQRIVGPGRGSQRIEGVEPYKGVWYTFSAFIYAAIVAMVLLACITTPLYQKEYFKTHRFSVRNWFVFTDMGFAVLFTIEAFIKVIADGFFWTPNAFFRSSWGLIDGLVLVTLWVNVGTSLYNEGAVSRAVGAFKALRALRLLNVSDSARHTFQSVIILGGWKVLSAAFVSLSLLIPFAIYGLNLFNGQMQQCNDFGPGIANLTADCVGEFGNTPYSQWTVLSPRTVSNQYFSFDNFGSSLFILFQVVSQEGWTDVLWQAESVTGRNRQPQPFASPGNAVFFVVFNLLGAVFVLTLFVSVFMRNYTEQTGVAFLTAEQRSWLELRKLLWQISPSKRPSNKPHQKWKNWCYRQAVKKHGRWQRTVTTILLLHLLLLVMEFHPEIGWWEQTRIFLFLAFTMFFILNIVIRIIGLTWTRFRRSSWDLYSVFSVSGTAICTVLLLSNEKQRVYTQLHKLFLVSIALLLIPRNNQLDQLFKTAAASLTAIGNLLATWFVLFLVYAIALTQTFGLTRFGPLESGNLNLRNVPKALILLFRTSCGEGWNQIMEDFAAAAEPNCVSSRSFFESDCGSAEWARALFVSWNILSMYIFVSLFVSLIFESFSYVYQRSSGLSIVSREEIRRFKQAWATYDPDGTGYISREAFPRLLGELSGVFEMRIYHGDHTVGSILEDCRQDPSSLRRNSETGPGYVDGIDLRKLAQRISQIPVHEIRRRRRRLNIFYEEVMVSADPDRGISFTSILMILSHYNIISDSKSLKLEEFLRRRARLQRVEEAVRRNIVIGFFDTMYWSRVLRRYLDHKEAARMQTVPTFAVPEIFIDEDDEQTGSSPGGADFPTSPLLSPTNQGRPVSSNNASSGLDSHGSRRGTLRNRGDSGPPSPGQAAVDVSPEIPSHRHGYSNDYDWPQAQSGGPGSPGEGRSRQNSAVSAQDVLDVLDNSVWGESIRRSFTQRRPTRHEGDDRNR